MLGTWCGHRRKTGCNNICRETIIDHSPYLRAHRHRRVRSWEVLSTSWVIPEHAVKDWLHTYLYSPTAHMWHPVHLMLILLVVNPAGRPMHSLWCYPTILCRTGYSSHLLKRSDFRAENINSLRPSQKWFILHMPSKYLLLASRVASWSHQEGGCILSARPFLTDLVNNPLPWYVAVNDSH